MKDGEETYTIVGTANILAIVEVREKKEKWQKILNFHLMHVLQWSVVSMSSDTVKVTLGPKGLNVVLEKIIWFL